MISRIIKVEVRVISQSRRLRLITLTETLIIRDITKTESNNIVLLYIGRKKKCDSKNSLANLDVVLLLHRRQSTQSAKPSTLADNSYRDLDYSGCHKTESNNCLLYIDWKKKCHDSKHSLANLDVVLLLHRRQATQSAWTWHDYPWKYMVIHDMITPDLDMIIV